MKHLHYILITILLTSAICSCRSVRYIPVESIKHDSIYITKEQRDSIYERDSIYVLVKGDTVFKYKDRFVYRDKVIRDTTYINHTDTITKVMEVEKPLSRWQTIKLNLGGYMIGALALFIIYFLYKIFRK